MDVSADSKYLKICENAKEAKRKLGAENARRLGQRIDDLHAAENLYEYISLGIGRPHQLKGNRKEHFGIDLKHPCRLEVAVDNDPVPRLEDGGIDTKAVTAVRIVFIGDYHD